MYVGIDPEVAANHRQLVNRHWAEMERLRNSARQPRAPREMSRIAARQLLGTALVNLGRRLATDSGSARTTTA